MCVFCCWYFGFWNVCGAAVLMVEQGWEGGLYVGGREDAAWKRQWTDVGLNLGSSLGCNACVVTHFDRLARCLDCSRSLACWDPGMSRRRWPQPWTLLQTTWCPHTSGWTVEERPFVGTIYVPLGGGIGWGTHPCLASVEFLNAHLRTSATRLRCGQRGVKLVQLLPWGSTTDPSPLFFSSIIHLASRGFHRISSDFIGSSSFICVYDWATFRLAFILTFFVYCCVFRKSRYRRRSSSYGTDLQTPPILLAARYNPERVASSLVTADWSRELILTIHDSIRLATRGRTWWRVRDPARVHLRDTLVPYLQCWGMGRLTRRWTLGSEDFTGLYENWGYKLCASPCWAFPFPSSAPPPLLRCHSVAPSAQFDRACQTFLSRCLLPTARDRLFCL